MSADGDSLEDRTGGGEGAGRRLPAGAHGIPPELVARNQRERLIEALVEACAEKGFAEVSVAEITKRAGVSTLTFYKQFTDKRGCLLAAHRELLGRLLDEVDRACEEVGGSEEKIAAAVKTALELLAADPPSARLLTVEALAAGAAGMEAQAAAIEAFASRLRGGRGPGASPGGADQAWRSVAAISMSVGRLATTGEMARLGELEQRLLAMALRSASEKE
jgi:AcrR family transcriptional regulator